MRDVYHLAAPIVKRESIALRRNVDGVEITKDWPVVWLRRSETRAVMMHGNAEIDDLVAHNDYYGLLRCLGRFWSALSPDSYECPPGRYEITADSKLRIDVQTRVFDQPMLEAKDAPHFGPRALPYQSIPQYWTLPETRTEHDHTWHPSLSRVEVLPWTVQWTTAGSFLDRDSMRAAFEARAEELLKEYEPDAD